MKFNISKTSGGNRNEVEINTLEELLELSRLEDCPLIIRPSRVGVQERSDIEIYDAYRE